MGNLWLNVRFGTYHLQCGGNKWWHVRWAQNKYHAENPPETFFKLYQFFGR